MIYSDFIPVKQLAGHLLISQKKNQWGTTLTTKELVFQKPHLSYHILLDDVIGIVPYEIEKESTPLHKHIETAVEPFTRHYYKLTLSALTIIRRQGIVHQGPTALIIPLNQRILDFLQKHTSLTVLHSSSNRS